MINLNRANQILIIADDFTGANDSGVQLAKKGAVVNVVFDWQNIASSQTSDVIVVNTDSRALPASEAKIRANNVIKQWQNKGLIYKKIDSILRGNLGAEIEATLETSQLPVAIVVPAFPTMHRVTKQGRVYVGDIELHKTEFATDPKTPIYSSSVKACINQQTHLSCSEIHINDVRSPTLIEKLNQLIKQQQRIIIIDAENDDDLDQIMAAIHCLDSHYLLVGSAGLINHLPTKYEQHQASNFITNKSPLLVIAGSMSETTQKQINYTLEQDKHWGIVDIDIETLLPDYSEKRVSIYAEKILAILKNQQHCIVRTCCDNSQRDCIEQYCTHYQFTRMELGEHISHFLGQLTNQITHQTELSGLFLTGGDIAIAIARSLGASGFRIEGEVSTGVPYGSLISDENPPYRIFTKAGAFGEPNIFIKTLKFI